MARFECAGVGPSLLELTEDLPRSELGPPAGTAAPRLVPEVHGLARAAEGGGAAGHVPHHREGLDAPPVRRGQVGALVAHADDRGHALEAGGGVHCQAGG